MNNKWKRNNGKKNLEIEGILELLFFLNKKARADEMIIQLKELCHEIQSN